MREEEHLLYDYCTSNKDGKLKHLLQKHVDLDLTKRDGVYFYLTIKHNNPAMLNTLLEYYEETKLQGDRESMEYKSAKHQLANILEDAEERLDISPEIQEIIRPYMPFTDEGLVLQDVKNALSNDGFTLPHFHQHLDIEGFNDATVEDLNAVLKQLEDLKSRLGYMYSGMDYEVKNCLIERQIQDIKAALDLDAELEVFGEELPDQWDGEDDQTSPRSPADFSELFPHAAADEHDGADYAAVKAIGDISINDQDESAIASMTGLS